MSFQGCQNFAIWEKRERVTEKWGIWGDCKNLKQILLLLLELFHDKSEELLLQYRLKEILIWNCRVKTKVSLGALEI